MPAAPVIRRRDVANTIGMSRKVIALFEAASARPLEVERSVEYGSAIIHSVETGVPRVVYGNVPNGELIANLPAGCCVEVPCLVDELLFEHGDWIPRQFHKGKDSARV